MATYSVQVNAEAISAAFAPPYIPQFYDYTRKARRRAEMAPLNKVIARCNKFTADPDTLWSVHVLDNSAPIGLMLSKFVEHTNWEGTGFRICKVKKTVRLEPDVGPGDDPVDVCRKEFVGLCEKNADNFDGFKKWLAKRNDYHPVRAVDAKFKGLKMPAPLRGVLGIVTTGVHMNMYTTKKVEGQDKIFVWVSKRTENVTYAGKLDQVVAGAMDPADAMDPVSTLRREAMEEAGLRIDARDLSVTDGGGARVGTVRPAGTIAFYDEKDHVAGCETGHLEPGIRFAYDLEVGPGFAPTPTEPESIAGFSLRSADEVKEDLKREEWKPNCGLVTLDFLLRHGQVFEGHDVESITDIKTELRPDLPLRVYV